MTKYREILRLKVWDSVSRALPTAAMSPRKRLIAFLKRARELNISWPLDKSDTDAVLAEMFFSFYKASQI